MTTTSYTPENLLPVYQGLLTELCQRLPPAMAATLRGRGRVERHGTCASVLLWTIWHARQDRQVIPPIYTAWSINYDPGHFETRTTEWIERKKIHARAGRGQGAGMRHGISKRLAALVLRHHGGKCALCGGAFRAGEQGIHIDHIIPFSKGGRTELANLRPSHAACNIRKGNGTRFMNSDL